MKERPSSTRRPFPTARTFRRKGGPPGTGLSAGDFDKKGERRSDRPELLVLIVDPRKGMKKDRSLSTPTQLEGG